MQAHDTNKPKATRLHNSAVMTAFVVIKIAAMIREVGFIGTAEIHRRLRARMACSWTCGPFQRTIRKMGEIFPIEYVNTNPRGWRWKKQKRPAKCARLRGLQHDHFTIFLPISRLKSASSPTTSAMLPSLPATSGEQARRHGIGCYDVARESDRIVVEKVPESA